MEGILLLGEQVPYGCRFLGAAVPGVSVGTKGAYSGMVLMTLWVPSRHVARFS